MKKKEYNYLAAEVKAGDILMWKSYSIFKEVWAWIRKEELPYNKMKMFNEDTLMYAPFGIPMDIVTPKKKYNKKEVSELTNILKVMSPEELCDASNVATIVNAIRPDTVDNPLCVTPETFKDSKFYVDVDWKLARHTSCIEQ